MIPLIFLPKVNGLHSSEIAHHVGGGQKNRQKQQLKMAGTLKESMPCFMRCRLECDRGNNKTWPSHLVEAAAQTSGALAIIVDWTGLHPTLSLSAACQETE
uniref:Uncharacterized protein n=1 Tax=Eutreptiella gymnastica TaxID=73025 RepID=A0A7S4LHN3_9EUGL